MFYPLIAAYLLLTGTLLVIGTVYRKPAALYALKFVWFPGAVLAGYLTLDAWKDRSYSENWAVIGVVFFVVPFTGLVILEGILEFLLLRGRQDSHSKAARIATAIFIAALLIFSLFGMLSA